MARLACGCNRRHVYWSQRIDLCLQSACSNDGGSLFGPHKTRKNQRGICSADERDEVRSIWQWSATHTRGCQMKEVKRILDQFKRSFEGGAWHGPSVQEVLANVTAEKAAAHPLP